MPFNLFQGISSTVQKGLSAVSGFLFGDEEEQPKPKIQPKEIEEPRSRLAVSEPIQQFGNFLVRETTERFNMATGQQVQTGATIALKRQEQQRETAFSAERGRGVLTEIQTAFKGFIGLPETVAEAERW